MWIWINCLTTPDLVNPGLLLRIVTQPFPEGKQVKVSLLREFSHAGNVLITANSQTAGDVYSSVLMQVLVFGYHLNGWILTKIRVWLPGIFQRHVFMDYVFPAAIDALTTEGIEWQTEHISFMDPHYYDHSAL